MKYCLKTVSLILAAVLVGSLISVSASAAPKMTVPAAEPTVLLAATKEQQQNAKRIVFLVNRIAEYSLDEYKADPEKCENAKAYADMVRDIVDSGEYDEGANGLSDALAKFAPYDAYFLALRDAALVEELSKTLDRFPTTESAVEKRAICDYVRRAINDTPHVDKTSPAVAGILDRALVLEANIPTDEQYAEQRRQNATLFIAAVGRLNAARSENDKMAAYREANRYYFYMDASVAGASEAVTAYLTFESGVAAKSAATETFIALVRDELKTAVGQDAIYAALAHCAAYADDVFTAITGAQEALNAYNRALTAYRNDAVSVNEEITEINSLAAGVRAAFPAAKKTVALLKKSLMLE